MMWVNVKPVSLIIGGVLVLFGLFVILESVLVRAGLSAEVVTLVQALRSLACGLLVGVAAAFFSLHTRQIPAATGDGSGPEVENQRVQWFIGLRWVILGVVVIVAASLGLAGLLPSPLLWYLGGWCVLLAAFNGFCALGLREQGRPFCDLKKQIIGDLLLLTFFLFLTGGISNPLSNLYLIHVILSAILLGKRAAYRTAFWAVGLMGGLVLLQGIDLIPGVDGSLSPLLSPAQPAQIAALLATQVVTLLAMAYLTGLFADTLLTHARHSADLAASVQEERTKLQAVVSQMDDGLMFIDNQGRTLFMNDTMKNLFGDDLDKAHHLFAYHPPEKREPVETLMNELTGNLNIKCHKHKEIQYHGRILETSMAPIRSEGGSLYGVLVMTHDITEQRHLQEQMIRQEKLTVLGRLAGTVAHELNNPLTAIAMFAELIVRHPCPCPEIRDYAQTILNNIVSCKRTAEHLLAHSPSEKLNRVPMDLSETLDETITLLGPLMKEQAIELTPPGNSLALTVLADPNLLRQALTNILMNALRAVEGQERKCLRLSMEAQGRAAVVTIQDNGPGIPAEHQANLFEPFFTTYPNGTGLGLAIVKGIVERHQGRIWFETQAG